jgi:hypothetical protein
MERLEAIVGQNEALDAQAKTEKEIEQAAEKEQKKNEKIKEQLKDLDAEIKYRKEIVTLGEKQAEINKLMAQDGMTLEQATEIQNRKAILEAMNFSDRVSPASAPTAMQAGSREAFAAIANSQAKAVSEEIKMRREQLRKQGLQIAAAERTNELLEQMEVA